MSVHTLSQKLNTFVTEALESMAIPAEHYASLQRIERPSEPEHGHFATPVALSVFGAVKKQNPTFWADAQIRSPRELADRIATSLREHTDVFSEVSIAGGGFVNMVLTDTFLFSELLKVRESEWDFTPQTLSNTKIMVEFTDPNPFKELHIGHLYSNIVGEAISRTLESCGATVQRVCYQGDVGMHVAKSVWGMRKLLAEEGTYASIAEALEAKEQNSSSQNVRFLGKAYALGATAYAEQPEVAEEIKDINYLTFLSGQENLVAQTGWTPQVDYAQYVAQTAQNYDEIKLLYSYGRRWSLAYFDRMYQRIGMHFDDFFFESVVGEFGAQIVREFLAKGIFEESQGAIIFPGEKHGLHSRVFINSLGLPTYEAKELGLAPEKYRRFAYDRSLIITGNEIDEYFKVLLKALELTNPELRKKTVHLSHGMVRLPDGKMSSRTGKVLTAEWLLDEAHARIKTVLAETRQSLTAAEQEHIAEVVGLSAIKFAFLKQSIGKDIAFNFDESLAFSGNSGPYLLYTLVRAHSILAKAVEAGFVLPKRYDYKQCDTLASSLNTSKKQSSAVHTDLLVNLLTYSDSFSSAATEYAPHHLAGHLFTTAQTFNALYGETQIVDTNEPARSESLLILTHGVIGVLTHGLHTLGIATVEKM